MLWRRAIAALLLFGQEPEQGRLQLTVGASETRHELSADRHLVVVVTIADGGQQQCQQFAVGGRRRCGRFFLINTA